MPSMMTFNGKRLPFTFSAVNVRPQFSSRQIYSCTASCFFCLVPRLTKLSELQYGQTVFVETEALDIAFILAVSLLLFCCISLLDIFFLVDNIYSHTASALPARGKYGKIQVINCLSFSFNSLKSFLFVPPSL